MLATGETDAQKDFTLEMKKRIIIIYLPSVLSRFHL